MTTARPRTRSRLARRALANLALAALAALLFLGSPFRAHAQSADADPPGRAARLSDVSGQVWLYGPDSNEWLGVARNRPLTTGDRIATDNNARAEISLGTTTLRLDAATELEVVRLDDARFVVRLVGGSVAARLRNAPAAAEFELDTDEGRFRIPAPGRFRFDRLDQASDVTVYGGQAVFEGRNSALPIGAGQHGQFWLDAGGAAQYTLVQPVRDAFAAWNDERDRAEDRVAVARYVSPEMTGAEDLDRYGRWEQTPEYGALWTPAEVPSNWAPYSSGHWAFVRPWGWTWVDDAPWGFAPFHYGRWVYHRDAWCWAPGTYVARPVYAPALVAWVGGPRVSVSVNIGGGPPVGWFPLAPREVYLPSYRTSTNYVRNVNITHVTNITNITTIVNNNRNGEGDRRDFANRRFPNAVTLVPASVLTGRQPVGQAAAQYRNNPQVRAFVADGRPGPALTMAPVATPAAAARGPDARPAPRPPFEGRAPGGFAGRGEGARPDAGREPARRDGGRPEGDRPGQLPAPLSGALPVGGQPTGAVGAAPRPGGAAAAIAPQRPLGGNPAAPPIAPQRPLLGEPAAPAAQPHELAAPSATNARPPALGDAAIGRPPRGGIGREPMAADAAAPMRVVPPSPVQRGQVTGDGNGNGNGRPGLAPRSEPAITRVAPDAPRPADALRPNIPAARSAEPQRNVPPALQQRQERMNDAPRNVEPARVAPSARAPEARPAEPAARPESPRARDEPRRDDRKDDKR